MPLWNVWRRESRALQFESQLRSTSFEHVIARAVLGLLVGATINSALVAQPKVGTLAQPKPTAAPKKKLVEGVFPVGWKVFSDTTLIRSYTDTTSLVTKEVEGMDGMRFQSGPSSIAWSPKNVAQGNYVLIGQTFLSPPVTSLLKPGYGIVFGGKNLGTPNASYSELLVRNDGSYMLRQHAGSKITLIKDWTATAGISQHSGRRDEMAGNIFRIIVDERAVQFVVNRSEIYSVLRSTLPTDGLFGIRVGTDQGLDISFLKLDKSLPPAPPPARKPETVKPQPVKPRAAGVQTGQARG